MVGAKEFAMNRKVIEAKKKNPLLERILMPSVMKTHNKGLEALSGSFLDKVKLNSFSMPGLMHPKEDTAKRLPILDKPYGTRSENPILAEFRRHKTSMLEKKRTPAPAVEEKKQEDPAEEMSNDLANRITYKVFNGIKKYLDNSSKKPEGAKHIKLEICL